MKENNEKVKKDKNSLKGDRMYMPIITTNDC